MAALVSATIEETAISEYKSASAAGTRRVGWFWPVGLAVAASALGGLIWSGLVVAYYNPWNTDVLPLACRNRSADYQSMSWLALTGSVVGLLTLTFLVAGRLRVNRLATIVITAILTLPPVLLAALSLSAINGGLCLAGN